MDSLDVDVQSPPLKVLIIEDSAADAGLIVRALGNLPWPIVHRRVASEGALLQALTPDFGPDVILSDFSMPGFSGKRALEIVSAHAPDVPFLFVSGTIGEEAAIGALQRGAVDYVLKDNLRRLPSAVERALDGARARRERLQMELALRESEERFRSIVESSQDWVWEIDPQGRTTYSNAAAERLFGRSPQDMIGEMGLARLHPDDRAEVEHQLPDLMARRQGWQDWRLRWLHEDGSVRVLDSTATPILDAAGELIGYRGIDRDMTALLEQQRRITQMGRLHTLLAETSSAVLRASSAETVVSEACRLAVVHGGFLAACIFRPGPDGSLNLVACHGDQRVTEAVAAIARHNRTLDDPAQVTPGAMDVRTQVSVVSPLVANDRQLPDWVRTRIQEAGVVAQAMLPIGQPPWGVLGLYSAEAGAFDLEQLALVERLADEIHFATDFIAKSERLKYLAYFNPVSGLPNRAAFQVQLQAKLTGEPVAVAMVDIQRFGAINAWRGRSFGDQLLKQAGQRLRAMLGGGMVAHLEADTFALAYPSTNSIDVEAGRLETLIEEFQREPFAVAGQEIRIDLRGALACAPAHGDDVEALEHNVLAAMEEGGRRGLRVFAFNEELRGRAAYRLALEDELRGALARQEFELFYQPKFDAASRRLLGAEALLRWRHPQRGLVSPAEFIPMLEESALIVEVGRWVMAEALRTALAWREHNPTLRLAVNVSARELRQASFLADCRTLLEPHVADQPLDIEITESLLMENIDASMQLLENLRELGCKVAIDDFGTGYSSLNYLARLPVDAIKIDQSFTALMTQSPETLSLITNIIGMAHSLSLDVVAEGVEEEGQAHLLRLLRCDVLQGYLLGRPMPGAAFAEQFLGEPLVIMDDRQAT